MPIPPVRLAVPVTEAWARMPPIVAHRGGLAEAPENTVAAMRHAAAAGAGGVEFDVRLTRDEVPVLFHDADLGRTVPGRGALGQLDLRDVRALLPRDDPRAVPTLAEALDALPPDMLLDVELKADGEDPLRLPEAAGDVLRAAGRMDRVLVTSFDPDLALAASRQWGRPGGWIVPWGPTEEELDMVDLPFVVMPVGAATAEAVGSIQSRGRRVLSWAVNDVATAHRLAALDVGLITDRPRGLASAGFGARPRAS